MWHRVLLLDQIMQSSISWQRLSTYTCSYQLVFAITTVNFVIMCYFLKIADQVDCQLYLHSYLIFFAIVQTVKVHIFWEGHKILRNLPLTVCTAVKSKGKISQNCVAFSEYMNFKCTRTRARNFIFWWSHFASAPLQKNIS